MIETNEQYLRQLYEIMEQQIEERLKRYMQEHDFFEQFVEYNTVMTGDSNLYKVTYDTKLKWKEEIIRNKRRIVGSTFFV